MKTSKFEAHSHVFVEKQNKNVAKIYIEIQYVSKVKTFLPKIAEGVHEVTFSIKTNRNSPASDPSTELRRAAAKAIQLGPSNNLTGKSQS